MSVSVCGCCCFSAGCVYFCKSLRVCVCDCVYFFVTRVIIFAQGLLALWFLLCKMPKNYLLLLLLLWNEHWEWFNFLALPHCTCNTNKYLHFYVCMCVLCTLQLIYSIFYLIFVFICLFDALMLLRRVNGKTTRLRLTQRDHFTVKNFHSLRKIEMSDEHARERLNEWERDEACLQVCAYACVCVYVLALF